MIYFVAIYFNYNFEILRESIAITFFLLSYKYFVNRLWVKYFSCFLCAFMFHESSLIMLIIPLFVLVNKLSNKQVMIMVLGIYVILMLVDLVSLLIKIVPENFSFYMKFQAYMESEFYSASKVSNRLLSFFASVFFPFVAFYVLRKYSGNKQFSIIILLSIIFNILTLSVFIFYRFSNYILLPLSIAYLEVFSLVSKKFILGKNRLALFVPILSIYLIYKVDNVYFSGKENELGLRFYDRYYPYTFIFDNGKSKW